MNREFWRRALCWIASFALLPLVACGGESGDAGADTASDTAAVDGAGDLCIPSRAVFDATVKQGIVDSCGTCHGATPDFGAPHTLTGDYDSLIAGKAGQRLVDRMAVRLADKTMPPVGTPPMPHAMVDTLTEWASCGDLHPDHSVGLVVDKPVFAAPKTAPADTPHFDLVADSFAVAPDLLDWYQCFTFEAPVEEDRFIRRIEAVLDQSKVVHHIVLLKDPANDFALGRKKCANMPKDSLYLYAWAPGGNAIEFPEGGMRVKKGEHYVLQIHYNNGAGLADVVDKSGVRIWHAAPGGTEYGMLAPGPLVFSIPSQSTTTSTGQCKIDAPTTILAGMPHMHELGQSFRSEIVRADGSRETVVDLTGWSFEMQPFYAFHSKLMPGDRLETSCTWRNDGKETVNMGEKTGDEMCFLFAFVTPPPTKPYCNDFFIDADSDVAYSPGVCAGASPDPAPAKVLTKLTFDAAPTLKGGTLPSARWEMTSASLIFPAFAKGQVDAEKSLQIGRGQAWTEPDRLTIDAAVRLIIGVGSGAGVDTIDTASLSGKLTAGSKPNEMIWTPDFGGTEPQTISYAIDGDTLQVRLTKKFAQFAVPALYTFTRK